MFAVLGEKKYVSKRFIRHIWCYFNSGDVNYSFSIMAIKYTDHDKYINRASSAVEHNEYDGTSTIFCFSFIAVNFDSIPFGIERFNYAINPFTW